MGMRADMDVIAKRLLALNEEMSWRTMTARCKVDHSALRKIATELRQPDLRTIGLIAKYLFHCDPLELIDMEGEGEYVNLTRLPAVTREQIKKLLIQIPAQKVLKFGDDPAAQ